jgi:actin beta/gamma 1
MRDFWIYALEEGLQISELSSANLLIIDQCQNSKDYKHKIAEVLFDYLKVQSVLFMNSSSLSLFSTGSVT